MVEFLYDVGQAGNAAEVSSDVGPCVRVEDVFERAVPVYSDAARGLIVDGVVVDCTVNIDPDED